MEIVSALESFQRESTEPRIRTLQMVNGDWAVLVDDEVVLWLNRDYFGERAAMLVDGLATALRKAA